MSKEEAMVAYVDEMKLVGFLYLKLVFKLSFTFLLLLNLTLWKILEGMPMTDEVEELLRVIGPFYELIEEKKKILHVSDLSTGEVFSSQPLII